MNSLGSTGEEEGMNLGGGEEEENKEEHKGHEAEGCNICEMDWYTEVDDSWYPGFYIITKTKEAEEEEKNGEWMTRNKKGRVKPIMNASKDEEWE